MPTSYTDQFFVLDPAAPPPPGTSVGVSVFTLTDENDDADIDRFNGDSVDGTDITRSWPGDTVTLDVPGTGPVTYTGITFYLADGRRVFTPTDGQVLQEGTFVASTFVTTQGALDPADLGPACFTAGTRIAVPGGEVPVELLQPGDLVLTRDHGPLPLRWTGGRTVAGRGALAPVRFAPGTFGARRPLTVSPQHRMLVTGWQAEVLFGEREVLVAAKHLTHWDGVATAPCDAVTYRHLLFDDHQIVMSEGAWSESFHPGSLILEDDRETLAEIVALFPDLALAGLRAVLPAARPALTGRQARALPPA